MYIYLCIYMYNNCKMDVQEEKIINNTCESNRRRV